MSFFGTHQPINALSNFDIELQYFYSQLLSAILKTEKLKKMVLKSLGQDRIRHIQKTKPKNSLQNTAYVFRYGPCYTSAVANYMLRVIKNNPFIFRDALWKRCVNICCFGSAHVFEIVAICKIFSLVQDLFWESSRKPLQINVTVIGNRQWKKVANSAFQVLLKSNNICDASKMTIDVQYVKTNPTKYLNSSTVEILKDADIVTMVKFVSATRVETIMEQLIWEVADSMKIDGVLFFLDTGMVQHCKLFKSVLGPLNDFRCIYGPNNIEPFTLSIKSIQKSVEFFWSRFQSNICLTSCIVNSGAWVKSDANAKQNETKSDEIPLRLSRNVIREKVRKSKQEWCEKMVKSQKVLEDYHQKVQHILPEKNSKKEVKQDDDSCFVLDYPNLEEKVLFKSKCKHRRIYLDGRADYKVCD